MALDYYQKTTLATLFAQAINSVSAENDSNTPDFILAEYLVHCLEGFAIASVNREDWYGKPTRGKK
jgi:hypothetical protein